MIITILAILILGFIVYNFYVDFSNWSNTGNTFAEGLTNQNNLFDGWDTKQNKSVFFLSNKRGKNDKDIKGKTKSEAMKDIDKLKKDLFNFRFQKINVQLKNPAKINETKRNIARLKTLIEEKNA